jgi:hypothetical protein
MAAKRLGQALSDVEGTSKQLLRVKEDETGFEFVEPSTISEYTITDYDEDRELDASNTTLDELADVVATLIEDLADAGLSGAGGVSAFQWSTSEQVWPFEKARDGSTLYCKEIDFGALPNNGTKSVAHNIGHNNKSSIHDFRGLIYGTGDNINPFEKGSITLLSSQIVGRMDLTNITVQDGFDWSAATAVFRVWYKK